MANPVQKYTCKFSTIALAKKYDIIPETGTKIILKVVPMQKI